MEVEDGVKWISSLDESKIKWFTILEKLIIQWLTHPDTINTMKF